VIVQKSDVARLARHFDLDFDTALHRFTKVREGEPVLRHKKDKIYKTVCTFLDTKTRRCTVYEARPEVCREYPDRPRCGYFDFLSWEREFQDDADFIPMEHG